MTGTYWERSVYAVPPLAGLERTDESAVFTWLETNFPITGTKIDWSQTRARHVHRRISDDVELAAAVVGEVSQRLRDGSLIEHAGDNLSPYGVRFAGNNAPSIIAALLEIPEHHYFLAEDRSWVVTATSEGDLDVIDQFHLG